MLTQSISDIKGEGAFIECIELILMGVCVAFFFYYGTQFFRRWQNKDIFEVERKLNLGYTLFFLSLAFGYGSYVLDRIWRYIWDARLFFGDYDTLYTSIAGESADSAFSSDYFIVIFIGLSIGFIVLSYVAEKYILNRERAIIWMICIIGLVFTSFIRPIERVLLGAVPAIVEYIGFISYGIVLLVFLLLFILYTKIAKASPIKSDLWNRSVAVLIGITMMVMLLAFGNNQLSKLIDEGWGQVVGWSGPLLTLTALFILQYGLSKKE